MSSHIFRAEITTTSRAGERLGEQEPVGRGTALRHPAPHFEERAVPPLVARPGAGVGKQEKQLERVVSVLLRELSESRKEKTIQDVQLQTYRDLLALNSAAPAAKRADKREAPRGSVKAFRPAGIAPPAAKQVLVSSKQESVEADSRRAMLQALEAAQQHAEALASMQLDNAEMRKQLQAAEVQCQQLQARVKAAEAVQRPGSPGMSKTTVTMVSSPARSREQCDLTVAVFEPPGTDVAGLQQQLNKLQRDNLKLSSKVKAAEANLVNTSITAKRWEEACEAQAAQIAALKVDIEQERRYRLQLEKTIARAGDECDARDEDVSALLLQLRSTESAAAAAQGEVNALRSQLSQVEGLLAAKHTEVQELGGTINATISRLEASELVRQEAEREKDALVATNAHLQQELDEVQHRAGAECLELQSAVATLQQKLSAEEHHSGMLQAELQLVEQQARGTEQMLSQQLRIVQEERNACLAAATRADALLIKLGSHAWQLKAGVEQPEDN